MAVLATTWVVLGGLAACAGMIFAFNPNPDTPLLWLVVGTGLGIGFLAWLLRERPAYDHRRGWFWFLKRRPKKIPYQLKRRENTPPPSDEPPPQPPTVERLRELADLGNTWVPSTLAPPKDERRNTGRH
ncbi:MAG TPA: hypothetical protein VHB77_21070 [Planctomycetaceae bacterium]|nr:hypothetical protein [Planctomycetaceae bacterium]